MIDFKSSLSHITGKLTAFISIFAYLTALSITFVVTSYKLQMVKIRSNQVTRRLRAVRNDTKGAGVNAELTSWSAWSYFRFFHIILFKPLRCG